MFGNQGALNCVYTISNVTEQIYVQQLTLEGVLNNYVVISDTIQWTSNAISVVPWILDSNHYSNLTAQLEAAFSNLSNITIINECYPEMSNTLIWSSNTLSNVYNNVSWLSNNFSNLIHDEYLFSSNTSVYSSNFLSNLSDYATKYNLATVSNMFSNYVTYYTTADLQNQLITTQNSVGFSSNMSMFAYNTSVYASNYLSNFVTVPFDLGYASNTTSWNSNNTAFTKNNSNGFYTFCNIGIGTSNTHFKLNLGRDSATKPTNCHWTIVNDDMTKQNVMFADTEICYSNVASIPLMYFSWSCNFYPPGESNIIDRNTLGFSTASVKHYFPKSVSSTRFGSNIVTTLNPDQLYLSLYGAVQHIQRTIDGIHNQLVNIQNQIAVLSPVV
jgi:hypothetical protein